MSTGVTPGHVALTVALAWLLVPVRPGTVGFPQAPPVPDVGANSLVGHLADGVVLGTLYAAPVGGPAPGSIARNRRVRGRYASPDDDRVLYYSLIFSHYSDFRVIFLILA